MCARTSVNVSEGVSERKGAECIVCCEPVGLGEKQARVGKCAREVCKCAHEGRGWRRVQGAENVHTYGREGEGRLWRGYAWEACVLTQQG